MTRAARAAAPEMVIITDNCFCSYTTHGHCGVVVNDHVDNDLTLQNLQQQCVAAAEAGADMVAPSGMMDGMVMAIRAALDEAGFEGVGILSYSSKFASAFYGPFREAGGCGLKGDRKTYQIDPANGREAVMESVMDEDEGADMLMVKPGLAYLDIVHTVRQTCDLPLAVYQVSGEYAMLKAAVAAGALDEKAAVMETMTAFKRAGADMIITYFAAKVADWLKEGK
jgi:porphobilinogen synthase